MNESKSSPCPCCSGKPYKSCCQRYHRGELAENALTLMRSRYSAYALHLAPYLIATTHPESPYFVSNRKQWLKQIEAFSTQTSFDKLEILDYQPGEEEAFVTFIAHLSKDKTDLSFTEKSRFKKQGLAWLYIDGKIARGCLSPGQAKKL
ncbi:YchJ family protein [Candidatus Protochlamydia phocaeensis]|uniref:YchJ family protein n=1 Tax=Candidatus Protochlamydia phocaeensis TaxID=1414722 RepID=UPI0008397B22|nr:YchJ family metal-binding protein [Candidatus Protochlamydia phocaeensis]